MVGRDRGIDRPTFTTVPRSTSESLWMAGSPGYDAIRLAAGEGNTFRCFTDRGRLSPPVRQVARFEWAGRGGRWAVRLDCVRTSLVSCGSGSKEKLGIR